MKIATNYNYGKMMKNLFKYILICMLVWAGSVARSQQKIGDGSLSTNYKANADALLELESSVRGLLHSRVALVATNQPAPLSAHVVGMMVYNTSAQNDVVPGIYYSDGTKWVLAGAGPQLDIEYNESNHQLTVIRPNGQTQIIDFLEIIRSIARTETITELRVQGGGKYIYYNEAQYQVNGALKPDATGVVIDIPKETIDNFALILGSANVQNLLLQFIENQIGHVKFDGDEFIYVDANGVQQQLKVVDMVRENQLLSHVLGAGPVSVTATANAANIRQTDFTVAVDFAQLNPILTTTVNVINLQEAFSAQGIDVRYAAELSVIANAQNGAIEITLPAASTNRGRKVSVKKFDASGNRVSVKALGGERVEGQQQISGFTPYQGWVFQSNGTEWIIISRI